MEDLMELVAASLVRQGVQCPADDPAVAQRIRSSEPVPPSALPEHSFRKKPEVVAT